MNDSTTKKIAAEAGMVQAATDIKKDAKAKLEGQARGLAGRSVGLYLGLSVFFGLFACGLCAAGAFAYVLGFPAALPVAFLLCTAAALFTSVSLARRSGLFAAYIDVYDKADGIQHDPDGDGVRDNHEGAVSQAGAD